MHEKMKVYGVHETNSHFLLVSFWNIAQCGKMTAALGQKYFSEKYSVRFSTTEYPLSEKIYELLQKYS